MCSDVAMQLNLGWFEYNGRCGYILGWSTSVCEKINFTLETKAPFKFVTLVSGSILVKFHATTLGVKPCSSLVYLFHSVDIAKTF